MNNLQILIQNGENIYFPLIEEGVTWETERKGTPGKLSFKILNDGNINFEEGNSVRMSVDNNDVFYGFAFTQKRSKDKLIPITCYDQLRYFKNKDTYTYVNKTAGDVVKMLSADFNLRVGNIENTGYVIPSRVEDNTTLFDITQNALDLTLTNTGQLYVLYDDFGKICLKNINNMRVIDDGGNILLIDVETAGDFDYSSSIDSNTYNKIKLIYENDDTGTRDVFIAKDTSNINKWGVLQYFDTIDKNVNGAAKANSLLSLYNKKTRNLQLKDCIGDIRVRAGSMLIVCLDLGDVKLKNWMIVEKAKHTFKNKEHFMDLTLVGNNFTT